MNRWLSICSHRASLTERRFKVDELSYENCTWIHGRVVEGGAGTGLRSGLSNHDEPRLCRPARPRIPALRAKQVGRKSQK